MTSSHLENSKVEQLLSTILSIEIIDISRNSIGEERRTIILGELYKALRILPYRECEIIKLRYGIGDGHPYTRKETAKIFGVTGERIRQIKCKAIRSLQHPSCSGPILEEIQRKSNRASEKTNTKG